MLFVSDRHGGEGTTCRGLDLVPESDGLNCWNLWRRIEILKCDEEHFLLACSEHFSGNYEEPISREHSSAIMQLNKDQPRQMVPSDPDYLDLDSVVQRDN